MTSSEAKARAEAIWGPERFLRASEVGEKWWVTLTGVRVGLESRQQSDWTAHTLDVDGHAVCHKACAKLEAANG